MEILYQGSMFQIPFLHLKVDKWKEKKSYLMSCISKNKVFSGNDPLQSNTDYHHQIENKSHNIQPNEVKNLFKEELNSLNSFIGTTGGEITNSWFELAQPKQFHSVHNHGTIGYSSVCFVEYNSEIHTPTNFICPFHNVLSGDMIHFTPQNIDEGSIIFFPSLIPHSTVPNSSEVPRIIFSFNIRW